MRLSEDTRSWLRDVVRAKSRVNIATGCLIWVGPVARRYGYLRHTRLGRAPNGRGAILRAHRASWLAFKGAIPRGLWVLHKCDVPRCVNAEHLFLGTALDNMQDARRKNRLFTVEINRRIADSKTQEKCLRGHPFSGDNLKVDGHGRRHCRACIKIRNDLNCKRRR